MKKLSFTVSSQKLILVASLYFGTVLNLSFWRFIYEHLSVSNLPTVVFLFSLPLFIIVPLILFFSLIIFPYLAKPLLIILLCISATANYAMVKLGIFIDSDMYRNIIETNFREASDLVTLPAVLWFLATAAAPALFLACTRITYQPWLREIRQRLKTVLVSLLILLCFVPLSYKEYVSFGRNNREVRKLINTFNYIYAVGRYYQHQSLAKRQFVVLDNNAMTTADSHSGKKALILVVGETARAQNFSLYGYERETTPLLAQQNIIAFQDTSSCGTATAVSLPCMFSHLERRRFDVNDAYYTQNLVDLLQTAGYNLLWRENDDGCKGVCKRIPAEDMVEIGGSRHCFGDFCRDEVLLEGLDNKLKNLKQNTVIILHTMGSHGPTYYKRYPDSFKKFTPACETADLQNCTRQQIINTYDNTILYTDYVISSVIDTLKRHSDIESGMIYISDHGESLGENNIYLHGLPYRIAPQEQKKIPFLLWMSEKLKKHERFDESCLRRHAAQDAYSHDNLFHSVLGLLNVRTTAYKPELDIFRSCRQNIKPPAE